MNSSEPASTSSALTRLGSKILRTRAIVRLPISLFRWGLGFVFGGRLLMLEHLGRKSGRVRSVVLEIIDRPAAGGYVVVSGFGEKAQWFRNISADPRVRVTLGAHKPVAALVHRMPETEAQETLAQYAVEHPKAWANLQPILQDLLGAEFTEGSATPPIVCIIPADPRSRRTT